MVKVCYTTRMKIEFNPEDLERIKKLEDIIIDNKYKKHQAVCGYIGGGAQDVYADIDLGTDFVKALTIYANEHDLSLQCAIRLVMDDFCDYFIKTYSDKGDTYAHNA